MSLISAMLLFSCSLPTHRETVETFILLDNGGILETQFTKSDTGIYKGQGLMSLNRWFKSQTPLSFAFHANDIDTKVSKDKAAVGVNFIEKLPGNWRLKIRSDDFNATGVLQGIEGPSVSLGDWETSITGTDMQFTGWASGAKRSAPLSGKGILIHQKGSEMPISNRMLFFASGDDLTLGIDYHPPKTMAWGKWAGLDLTENELAIDETPNGLSIKAEQWTAEFIAEERLGELDPHSHLFWPERFIASAWLNDNIEARYSGIVILKSEGKRTRGTAIVRRQESTPLIPSQKASKKLSKELEITE